MLLFTYYTCDITLFLRVQLVSHYILSLLSILRECDAGKKSRVLFLIERETNNGTHSFIHLHEQLTFTETPRRRDMLWEATQPWWHGVHSPHGGKLHMLGKCQPVLLTESG